MIHTQLFYSAISGLSCTGGVGDLVSLEAISFLETNYAYKERICIKLLTSLCACMRRAPLVHSLLTIGLYMVRL